MPAGVRGGSRKAWEPGRRRALLENIPEPQSAPEDILPTASVPRRATAGKAGAGRELWPKSSQLGPHGPGRLSSKCSLREPGHSRGRQGRLQTHEGAAHVESLPPQRGQSPPQREKTLHMDTLIPESGLFWPPPKGEAQRKAEAPVQARRVGPRTPRGRLLSSELRPGPGAMGRDFTALLRASLDHALCLMGEPRQPRRLDRIPKGLTVRRRSLRARLPYVRDGGGATAGSALTAFPGGPRPFCLRHL
ncbi:uncharacterized protein LOC127549461 [Antechinus flavipes]|uniref:uncharacterized protein LOC127549461 n=1 Tax=Antechinus flavipes TaxID=38775 RepID=UPI0022360345|nr:uncharacterized protein LOC127549461 [Antechinus flavipes]